MSYRFGGQLDKEESLRKAHETEIQDEVVNIHGDFELLQAVEHGDVKSLERLIKSGEDVKLRIR